MALGPIPPWLEGPNTLGILSAGSKVGLEQQQLRDARNEAAARIALGYAQLRANQQSNALDEQWRQRQFDEQTRRANVDDLRQNELLSLSRERESRLADSLSFRMADGTEYKNVGGNLVAVRPGGQVDVVFSPNKTGIDPSVKMLLSHALKTQLSAKEILADPWKQAAHEQAKVDLEEANATVAKYLPVLTGNSTMPSTNLNSNLKLPGLAPPPTSTSTNTTGRFKWTVR